MHISVFGTGYVGLVSGTCFSEIGNRVVCFDIDAEKINGLKKGAIPIYEPGLEELVKNNLAAGRLHFSNDIKEALRDAEILFLAVGTPPCPDGSADLKYIDAAARDIARNLDHNIIIATKSTVPVGTADRIREIITTHLKGAYKVDVVSNPEFLREGAAVKDFLNPERVIVGIDDQVLKAPFTMLYQSVTRSDRPLIFMGVRSAELTKYASNAFLATKISFANEMALLCEKTGGDIRQVTYGMGFDSRIGSRFLHAGIGYGGSCFPKDVRALRKTAADHGLAFSLIDEVENINDRQKLLPLAWLKENFRELSGKTIAVWGLSFKPRTNDIREAPALSIIPALLAEKAIVKAYDPKAMPEAQKVLSKEVIFCKDALEAAESADAVLILTEWDEFRSVDFAEVKQIMRGKCVFDGRNIYSPEMVGNFGLTYKCVGDGSSQTNRIKLSYE